MEHVTLDDHGEDPHPDKAENDRRIDRGNMHPGIFNAVCYKAGQLSLLMGRMRIRMGQLPSHASPGVFLRLLV